MSDDPITGKTLRWSYDDGPATVIDLKTRAIVSFASNERQLVVRRGKLEA